MIDELSKQLFSKFVINKRYYSDGKFGYRASRIPINSKTIIKMLESKSSLLCYQEEYNETKWICFDFDIVKNVTDSIDFDVKEESLYNELFIEINKLTKFLTAKGIDFLIEFSGNRGLHLWILFSEKISRINSYIILKRILDTSEIYISIEKFALDKFPASEKSVTNTDRGKGIKCPLSLHPKSLNYTYFLEKSNNLSFKDIEKISLMNEKLLNSQYEILKSTKGYSKEELFEILEITDDVINEILSNGNTLKVSSVKTSSNVLNDVILELSNCRILETIFTKYNESIALNDNEKKIIVGLLNRLSFKDGEYIGKELLVEFFSRFNNYSEKITLERLENMNYFPSTCERLRDLYKLDCSCSNIVSCPLEYLKDFEPIQKDFFHLEKPFFFNIKKSQSKYSFSNDEIFLHNIKNKMQFMDYEEVSQEIDDLLLNKDSTWNYFHFVREEVDKQRHLYSLDADAKLITTFFIKVLDNFLHDKFSSRSYGYKFNPSFRKNYIFEPWLKQWNIYSSELKNVIFGQDFDNYNILKLDIKSCYDNISLNLLNISLHEDIKKLSTSGLINDDENKKLECIVSMLIKLSRKIMKSDVGLPQGPAYARYLAEYYLVDLDKTIMNILDLNESFYFRYVDDIFIFIPNNIDINSIFSTYKNKLLEMKLDNNEKKEFLGTVKDYRLKFDHYINSTKYFVDQVDKEYNIETANIIQKASEKLISILSNDGIIDESNLSFLYTHLNKDSNVERKKEELEEYVFKTSKGRGSFFKNFFKYYFEKYSINDFNLNHIIHIEGLKRDVFLNSLFELLHKKNETNSFNKVSEIVDYFITKENTYIGKLLLIKISLYINKPLEISVIDNLFLEKSDKVQFFEDLISSNVSDKICSELEIYIFDTLPSFKEKQIFNFLYNYCFLQANNLEKVVDFFVTYIEKKKPESLQYVLIKSQLQKYVQLLFISTIYLNDVNYIARLKPIFIELLIKVNTFEEIGFLKDLTKWVSKVNELGFEKSNIQSILTIIIDDNNQLSDTEGDKNGLLEHFYEELIKVLYLSTDIKQFIEKEELMNYKKRLIEEKGMIYLDWLGSSDFYPNEEICIKNAIENDIIVLKRSDKFLVRIKTKHESQNEFDYLLNSPEIKIEKIFNGEYKNIIYSYNYNDYKSIYHQISSKNQLLSLISYLNDINVAHQEFRNKYFNSTKYISLFDTTYEIHNEYKYPLVPYYIFSEYNILPKKSQNNKINYYKSFIKLIVDYKDKFTLPVKSLNIESFLPVKLLNEEEQFNFLLEYFQLQEKESAKSIFIEDKNIILTLFKSLDMTESNFNFYTLFKHYFNFEREEQKYLIFNVIGLDLNYKNLSNFYNMISYSLKSNNFESFDTICNYLDEELKNIASKIVFERFDEYKLTSLEVNNISAQLSIIKIDNNVVSEDKILLLDLNYDSIIFKPINKILINELNNLEYLFYYKEDDIYKIIRPHKILYKIKNILELRSYFYNNGLELELFNSSFKIEELQRMDGFHDAIEVLKSNHYKTTLASSTDLLTEHLFEWMKIFRTNEERKTVLTVISKHKFIQDTSLIKVEKNILEIANNIKDKNVFATIKDPKDFNGTDRLLNLLNESVFLPRKINLMNFTECIIEGNYKEITFIVDVIISGTQFCNAFKNHYLSDALDIELIKNENYYTIENHLSFKDNMQQIEKLNIVTAFYTSKSEEKIRTVLRTLLPNTKVFFYGDVEDFDVCIFKSLRHNVKEKFKEIIRDKDFIQKNFSFDNLQLCKEFNEKNTSDENIDEMDIVARINSMPKKSFCLFFAKTKYYPNSLFKYIED